jgi:hypothetical protein
MQERRAAPRYKLPLRIDIKQEFAFKKTEILCGQIHDISISGVYFTSPVDLVVGDEFEFSATLPMRGSSLNLFVEVQAWVVRVERERANRDHRPGVAAVIEDYRVVRTRTSTC